MLDPLSFLDCGPPTMTKREWAAMLALQGLLAGTPAEYWRGRDPDYLAVQYADNLLARLTEKTT